MPTQRQIDEVARALRNNRAADLQRKQIADQAAAQIRMQRRMQEQSEGTVRMKGPRPYEDIQDEYISIERRMEGLTPGGRGGFDDILRENLQERLNELQAEVDARGVVEELDIPAEVMRQPTPVQQQQARSNDPRDFSRPGERRNKRNFPWLLDDGIHFDKQNVPFKVRGGKIVEMDEEEAAKAAELANLRGTRALTPEEAENRVTIESIRQSEEFRRRQQESLERLREEKFKKLTPEQQEQARAEQAARQQAEDEAAAAKLEENKARIEEANKQAEKQAKSKARKEKKKAAPKADKVEEAPPQDPQQALVEALSSAIPDIQKIENQSAEKSAQDLVEFLNEVNKLVEAGNLPQQDAQVLFNNYSNAIEQSPKSQAIISLIQGDD